MDCKIIYSMLMSSIFLLSPCQAAFEEYEDLLEDHRNPAPLLEGASGPQGPIGFQGYSGSLSAQFKFKALIADPDKDSFDPHWTKLKQYFNDKPIAEKNLLRMGKNGEHWELIDGPLIWKRRYALCRDIFAQLDGSLYDQVDIYQTGHFRFDVFRGDTHPGAATKASKEMYDFRNILLRQGLFQRHITNISFSYHYITSESLADSYDPVEVISEWKRWTNGNFRKGGGAGQDYGTLKYSYDYNPEQDELIHAIHIPSSDRKEILQLKDVTEFLPYTKVIESLNVEQLNSLIQLAAEHAPRSRLEVLEVNLKEDHSPDNLDQTTLRRLTGKHGIFLKINLSSYQHFGPIINDKCTDLYHSCRIILSSPDIKQTDIPKFLSDRYKRFNLVYGEDAS